MRDLSIIYVRYVGPTSSGPRLGPYLNDPGKLCPACNAAIAAGDATAVIPLGPGANMDAQERAQAGRAYNAVAIEIHWRCAGGAT